MSMLTLHGVVHNVFDTPARTDKKTGEVFPAATRVQLLAENTLQNGQKRAELVNLKVVDGDAYRLLSGKPVSVPVGCFVSGTTVFYYALTNEKATA